MERKRIYLVGLGPGGREQMTQQAYAALADADVLCGYTGYVDLVRGWFPEKETYTTPMTQELARCRWALETARIWHGWPSAPADRGRGRGGDHSGARCHCGAVRRRYAGGSADARLLCDLTVRSAYTLGPDCQAAGVRGRGGQRYRFVQPRLQEAERASAAGL